MNMDVVVGDGSFLQLPEVFRWQRTETDFYRRLSACHSLLVRMKITRLGASGSRIASALADMPWTMRSRIELAPEVLRLLYFTPECSAQETCEVLKQFLVVEKYIEGPGRERPLEHLRSALGDVHVRGTNPGRKYKPPASYRQVGNSAFAPVAQGLPVIGDIPFAFQNNEADPFAMHCGEEFREAVSRLRSALQFIRTRHPSTYAMLKECQRVVAVFRRPLRPDNMFGVSLSSLPGMAGFANLPSRRWSTEKIVDAVIHEGIHAVVSKVALFEPLLSRSGRRMTWVVSPWSGRRLELDAFIHACFVWFGLWNFWRQTGCGSDRGSELAERARKGFQGGSLLKAIPENARQSLNPHVVEAIESMAAEASAKGRR